MEILKNKTDLEILDSVLAEVAKSSNEVRCAQQDIVKIQNRLSFVLVLINDLREKALDKQIKER